MLLITWLREQKNGSTRINSIKFPCKLPYKKKESPVSQQRILQRKKNNSTVQVLLFKSFCEDQMSFDVDRLAISKRTKHEYDCKEPRPRFGTCDTEYERENQKNGLDAEQKVLNCFHIFERFISRNYARESNHRGSCEFC